METAEAAKRSCGTCRDRRIACDRTLPICSQCSQSKRACKGFGLRLFWPRKGDKRRALVANPVDEGWKTRLPGSGRIIHTSTSDVEAYHQLASAPDASSHLVLDIPMSWNRSEQETLHGDLLEYFETTAAHSLTTFVCAPLVLGAILKRLALAGNTNSTEAVLHSLLSLSSLQRSGVHTQAMRLKISSIRALGAASHNHLGPLEIVQHIAASMLLLSVEVHQAACTSNQWTWYIAGIKRLLGHPYLTDYHDKNGLAVLGDWVHYHEVLARFTLRHWHADPLRIGGTCPTIQEYHSYLLTRDNGKGLSTIISAEGLPDVKRLLAKADSGVSRMPPSAMATLEVLSALCKMLPARPPSDEFTCDSDSQAEDLKALGLRIEGMLAESAATEASEMATIVELYQLSMWLYLHRATGNTVGQTSNAQKHIDKAFGILGTISACERHFPVFILGCEARMDDQRTVILNLISRTETRVSSRSFGHVEVLLRAAWAQDDLADGKLSYWKKLDSIIGACIILPSLV